LFGVIEGTQAEHSLAVRVLLASNRSITVLLTNPSGGRNHRSAYQSSLAYDW